MSKPPRVPPERGQGAAAGSDFLPYFVRLKIRVCSNDLLACYSIECLVLRLLSSQLEYVIILLYLSSVNCALGGVADCGFACMPPSRYWYAVSKKL